MPRGTRRLATSLAFVLVLGLLFVPTAASATTSAEQTFVNRVNSARSAKGMPALVVNTKLAVVARGWSATMASRDSLSHRPALGTEVSNSVTDDWDRVGENVGYTTNANRSGETALVDRIHAAFMDSPGHRANILGAYNQVGVGVVVAGNGKMWVTVNFMQGPVAQSQSKPAAPESPFSAWAAQPAMAGLSAPAAVSWSEGRSDLFAIDAAGNLQHRWFVEGRGWSPAGGWGSLGRPGSVKLVGQPAVASQGKGSLDVVARGSDNAVWQRYYRPGKGWSRWASLGGVITHSPAAVSWAGGHLSVVATSPNGRVYHRQYDRGWSSWRAISSTKVGGSPSVASWGRGRLDVFVRGTDGSLRHSWFSGGRWGGWESLGGVLAGGGRPEAVSWGSGRLDSFVIGNNGHPYRMSYAAGSGWSKKFTRLSAVPGGFESGTSLLSWRRGHLELFTRAAEDGVIWHTRTP